MKPQQQTISVRVSDGLRRRLEHAKQIVANATGESISISDVARRFLEAAQDESVEAAELLTQPTETLLNIQRKWERHHGLSRPEWIVLGYYVQVGCEEVSQDPRLPTAESYAGLLEAFVAARALRVGRNLDRDRYYLGNLPQTNGDNGSGRTDLQAVPKELRGPSSASSGSRRHRCPSQCLEGEIFTLHSAMSGSKVWRRSTRHSRPICLCCSGSRRADTGCERVGRSAQNVARWRLTESSHRSFRRWSSAITGFRSRLMRSTNFLC